MAQTAFAVLWVYKEPSHYLGGDAFIKKINKVLMGLIRIISFGPVP